MTNVCIAVYSSIIIIATVKELVITYEQMPLLRLCCFILEYIFSDGRHVFSDTAAYSGNCVYLVISIRWPNGYTDQSHDFEREVFATGEYHRVESKGLRSSIIRCLLYRQISN